MTTNSGPTQVAPDTIVLIHGLWITPRSWEKWIPRYESHGFRVLAPAYPGFEVEVEDRGVGAAGVSLNSAVVKGVRRVTLSQLKSFFTVLDNPAHRHQAVGFTPSQFHYSFTNTLSEEESQPLYDRYHIPAPGRIIWDGVLANFSPNSPAKVDFKKPDRAPLLFIAGGEDHVNPAAVNKSNYKHQQKSGGITNYVEFADRPHFMPALADWESIADLALAWAVNHTAPAAVKQLAPAV